MRIIRKEESSVETNCLALEWGIPQCCIEGCDEQIVDAIIIDNEHGITYGVCKKHFLEYSKPGSHNIRVSFYLGELKTKEKPYNE